MAADGTRGTREGSVPRPRASRRSLLAGAGLGVALGLLNWFVLLPAVTGGNDQPVAGAPSSVVVATAPDQPAAAPVPTRPATPSESPVMVVTPDVEATPAPLPTPHTHRDPFAPPDAH